MRVNLLSRVQREFDWDTYVRNAHTVKHTPTAELRICCVNCDDTKFKLYVNPVKGVFYCFKCDFNSNKYDVVDFVAKSESLTRHQALVQLIREYARTTPEDEDFEQQVKDGFVVTDAETAPTVLRTLPVLPKGLLPLTATSPGADPFWTYLTSRGLTPQEIQAIGIHYTPKSQLLVFDSKNKRRGDLANRVVIPIYGGNHDLVSWQARHIDPNYPGNDKYFTCPESDLSKTFWPYVPPYDKHVVLVEGVFDALAVRRIPGVSAYATFSKKISLEQMKRLKQWGVEEVTLFWDKRDAKKEMESALPELHMQFKRVYLLWLHNWPEKLDAGNMLADLQGADKLKEALKDRVDTYDTLEFAKWKLNF